MMENTQLYKDLDNNYFKVAWNCFAQRLPPQHFHTNSPQNTPHTPLKVLNFIEASLHLCLLTKCHPSVMKYL